MSYAHVDNDPFPGAEKGWVTNLVNGLKIHLNKKLGRRENYSLWMDYELRGNQAVTPAINGELDGSATFLLFLSTGYLASAWCQQELAAFVKQAGSEAGRIFIVELESLAYPAALGDLKGYPFWFRDDAEQIRMLGVPQPKTDEQEYYTRLEDLGRDLAGKIGARQEQAEPRPPIATVYLAQVSDDLAARRAEMARYLDQAQMRVLPERNYSIDSFADEMAADLSQCKIFVQLLSERLGNRIPAFQHRAAVDAGLPILQWRDRETKPANIDDEEHRALLEAETVISGNLVDFQAVVNRALIEKPPDELKASVRAGPLVYVDAGQDDMELARKAADLLMDKGIASILPLHDAPGVTPGEKRKDLEDNLLNCDAVLMIYARSPLVQVRERLRYGWRMGSGRDKPYMLFAICIEEHSQRSVIGVQIPDLQILDAPAPWPDGCVNRFVEAIRAL